MLRIKKGVFFKKYSETELNFGVSMSKLVLPIQKLVSSEESDIGNECRSELNTYKYEHKPIYFVRIGLFRYFIILGGWYDVDRY